jgi:hypothetical protein
MFVLADDVHGDHSSVIREELFEAFEFELDELAAYFDLRGAAGRENEVAHMSAGLEHGGDELSSVDGALCGRSLGTRLSGSLRGRRGWLLRSGSHGSLILRASSVDPEWLGA